MFRQESGDSVQKMESRVSSLTKSTDMWFPRKYIASTNTKVIKGGDFFELLIVQVNFEFVCFLDSRP